MILDEHNESRNYAVEFPFTLSIKSLTIGFSKKDLQAENLEKFIANSLNDIVKKSLKDKSGECIIEMGFYFSYSMPPLLLLKRTTFDEIGTEILKFLKKESNNDVRFYQYKSIPWTDSNDFIRQGFKKGGIFLNIMFGKEPGQPLPDISTLKNQSIHCYHTAFQSYFMEFLLFKRGNEP